MLMVSRTIALASALAISSFLPHSVDSDSNKGFRAVLIYGGGLAKPIALEYEDADGLYAALAGSRANGTPQESSALVDRPCLRIAFFRATPRNVGLLVRELDPRLADHEDWFHPADASEPLVVGWKRAVTNSLWVERLAELKLPVRVGEVRYTPCERPAGSR